MDRRQRAILRAHREEKKRQAKSLKSAQQAAVQRERDLVAEIEQAGSVFRKNWKREGYPNSSVLRVYNGMTRKGQIKYKEVVAYLVAAGPTTYSMPNDNLEVRSFTSCYLLANGGWATAHHGGGSSPDLSPVDSFDTWLKRLRLGGDNDTNTAARNKIRANGLLRLQDPETTPPPKLPNGNGLNH